MARPNTKSLAPTRGRHSGEPNRKYAVLALLLGVLSVIWAGWFLLSLSSPPSPSPQLTLSEHVKRNKKVRLSIRNHHVAVLAGDYKRLATIKNPKFGLAPLDACTNPHIAPDGTDSHIGFEEDSFAYLLTLGKTPASSAVCTLDQVIETYGKPNQSILIAGSLDKPRELLLYYDNGTNLLALKNNTSAGSKTNTVLPISLDKLPHTTCETATTSLNIVAHEDDDLLFLSPAVLKNLQVGRCVRTIYLTAGDAGQNELYWQARERATEAAYASMLGTDKIWIYRVVKLADHQYITVINPKGNHNVSLIFMRLPDGHPNGSGFKATGNESLERLENGKIRLMHSVDGQSIYSESELITSLTALTQAYSPTEILSQTPFNASNTYPDHSDHMAVGRLVSKANQQYAKQHHAIPIRFYMGYPIRARPVNLSSTDIQGKEAAFLKYAEHDGAVCQSIARCATAPDYGSYLRRQYTSP